MQGYSESNMTNFAISQMAQVGQEVHELARQMAVNNGCLVDMFRAEVAKNERELRKKRKRMIQTWATVVNADLCLVNQYDDGTQGVEKLTLNLTAKMKVYRLKIRGINSPMGKWGIYFVEAGFWLLGEEKNLTGKYLCEELIKKDVLFNGNITRRKIETALFQFFAPQIGKAPVLEIPALAGWYNGKFATAETFLFEESEGLRDLPVRFKHMTDAQEIPFSPGAYFEELQKINNSALRLLMMLLPIKSLLNTLLAGQDIFETSYWNFVILEDVACGKILRYLQIFNRGMENGICTDEKMCVQAKDELVIFNLYSNLGESEYQKEQKKRRAIAMAEAIVRGELFTPDGVRIASPVVILSAEVVRKKRAVNVFVDDNFMEQTAEPGNQDAIGRTFWEFILFCEENQDEIIRMICTKKQQTREKKGAGLMIAYAIFEKFWEALGVNMEKNAGVQAEMLDALVNVELVFEDDIVSDVVTIIRKEIANYAICPKNQGKGTGNEIFYSDHYIWIPTSILDQMFLRCGIKREKYQLLEKLRRDGEIITDGEGLSRKLQVAGKRFETYQFRRGFFNEAGVIDIVDVGGEDDNR